MGVGAPSGVDGKWSEGLFRSVQNRDRRATVRGEQLDLMARQTNLSIARLTACRDCVLAGAATALKERETTTATTKSPGPRWARSPWTTNPSTPSRGAGGQTPFGPQEVETMRQTLQSSVRHF